MQIESIHNEYGFGDEVMDEKIVDAVLTISLAICKKHGYLNPPSRGDVIVILEAIELINKQERKKK